MNEPTRDTGMTRKILIAANFVAVGLLIVAGYYNAPSKPTVPPTCHTVHEAEYCHWSDGGYSMTMPDGAFYTRQHVNDAWERSADSPRDEMTIAPVRGGSKTKPKS
jgi:hypothetical protein